MAGSSIQQAVLALEETLDLLVELQQHESQSPILGPEAEASLKHDINIAFQKERFCSAIKCLRDHKNMLLLGQFFDRIFNSLYVQLEAFMQGSMNSLIPQLELISDIIHATYRPAVETRVDAKVRSDPLSDWSIVLGPIMNNLLIPIRDLLESMRERLVVDDVEDLPSSPQVSSKCNEVLTPILIAVMEAHDEGSDPSIALTDSICLILSLYDEYLLPTYLSTNGSEPQLISGLLALMQHLKLLRHIDHIQRATDELTARLYS
ncbi:hypothetical protein BGX26_005407 [Mortierella sp. AD094]|nr:hypothetical protein BGX26_005407 [Mortierella sp. AD094]